jgi:hypothetical protein
MGGVLAKPLAFPRDADISDDVMASPSSSSGAHSRDPLAQLVLRAMAGGCPVDDKFFSRHFGPGPRI